MRNISAQMFIVKFRKNAEQFCLGVALQYHFRTAYTLKPYMSTPTNMNRLPSVSVFDFLPAILYKNRIRILRPSRIL